MCTIRERYQMCSNFPSETKRLSKSDRLTAVPFEIQGMSTIWNIAMSEHATEKVISECESLL